MRHIPTLAGMTIVMSTHVTYPVMVRRTWRERLLSWPWRPWVQKRIVQVPDRHMYLFPHNKPKLVVCHPSMFHEVRAALGKCPMQKVIRPRPTPKRRHTSSFYKLPPKPTPRPPIPPTG